MSASQSESFEKELADRFRAVLDRHGHGFQYTVIRKLHLLFERNRKWLFEVAEFPVATSRHDPRIDFIIRPQGTRLFLTAECKQANPALNDWCFVRAPYVCWNSSIEVALVEEIVNEWSDADPATDRHRQSHLLRR